MREDIDATQDLATRETQRLSSARLQQLSLGGSDSDCKGSGSKPRSSYVSLSMRPDSKREVLTLKTSLTNSSKSIINKRARE